MTVQELINSALLELGETEVGETPSTAESNNAFLRVNQIISSWSLEGITAYTQALSGFSLTANVGSYTLGPAGSWPVTTRPVKIKGASVTYQGLQQGIQVLPMGVFEQSLDHNARTAAIEYLANGQPASTVLAAWASGNMPVKLGEDSAAPTKNVRVWPIPTQSATIELSYWVPLTLFSALSDTVTFPVPGYEAALVTELAVVLAPSYARTVQPELLANMQRFKARINEINGQIEIGPPPAAG